MLIIQSKKLLRITFIYHGAKFQIFRKAIQCIIIFTVFLAELLEGSSMAPANKSTAFRAVMFVDQQIIDAERDQAAATEASCSSKEDAGQPGTSSFLGFDSGQNSYLTRWAGDIDSFISVKVDKLNFYLSLAHDCWTFLNFFSSPEIFQCCWKAGS